MKPVSAIELYKATPKTNCKECGFATCLAFATCVIVEKKPLETCPYLTEEVLEALGNRIHEQQSEGVYVKRDLYKITADHIRERIESHDFSAIAEGLGAQYVAKEDQPHLRLSYLNRDCLMSKQEIWIEGSPADDHWDNILLYNYVHFSGNEPIRGRSPNSGTAANRKSRPTSREGRTASNEPRAPSGQRRRRTSPTQMWLFPSSPCPRSLSSWSSGTPCPKRGSKRGPRCSSTGP